MTDGIARSGGRALVRLLRALARPAACVELAGPAGELDAVALVLNGSGPTPDVLYRAPSLVWNRAVAAGLVSQGAACGTWQITDAGRAHLSAHDRDRIRSSRGPVAESRSQPNACDCPGGRKPQGALAVNPAESPLAWLARRKDQTGATMISEDQFVAGERLRFEFEQAQLMPRMTVDWQRAAQGGSRRPYAAGSGLELTERADAARQRVNRALSAVGPELANVLIDVCCYLKGLEQLEKESGWPQRSGKIVLRVALSALARHYGIGAGRDRVSEGPARVRHWGVEGYRPSGLEDDADSGSVA